LISRISSDHLLLRRALDEEATRLQRLALLRPAELEPPTRPVRQARQARQARGAVVGAAGELVVAAVAAEQLRTMPRPAHRPAQPGLALGLAADLVLRLVAEVRVAVEVAVGDPLTSCGPSIADRAKSRSPTRHPKWFPTPKLPRCSPRLGTIQETFSEPGEYWVRGQVNDASGDGGGGDQCCWTNVHVKVVVKP